MTATTEAETLAELVADCAAIPRPEVPAVRAPAAPAPWTVDDACHAQVAELDAYV